jgi:hypothetical protein
VKLGEPGRRVGPVLERVEGQGTVERGVAERKLLGTGNAQRDAPLGDGGAVAARGLGTHHGGRVDADHAAVGNEAREVPEGGARPGADLEDGVARLRRQQRGDRRVELIPPPGHLPARDAAGEAGRTGPGTDQDVGQWHGFAPLRAPLRAARWVDL